MIVGRYSLFILAAKLSSCAPQSMAEQGGVDDKFPQPSLLDCNVGAITPNFHPAGIGAETVVVLPQPWTARVRLAQVRWAGFAG